MHIFRDTRIGGYIFFNIVAPGEGGEVIKFLIKQGTQKYCRGTFENSWPPYSKENGGRLKANVLAVIRETLT